MPQFLPYQRSIPMTDPWIEGWKELLRLALRSQDRFYGWKERRRLDDLEAVLGELCWQQVDFDPSVEKQIQGIQSAESEQVRLTNQIAEITEQREIVQAESQNDLTATRAQILAFEKERQTAREKLLKAQPKLSEVETHLAVVRREIQKLESEAATDAKELEKALLEGNFSPEFAAWRKAMEERTAFIQQSIDELKDEQGPLSLDLHALKKIIATTEQAVTEHDKSLSSLRLKEKALEKNLNVQLESLQARQRELHGLRGQLDVTKKNHFRRLGSDLADVNISPRNQPEALVEVLESRERWTEYQKRIDKSRQQSDYASSSARRICYLYLALAVLGVLGLLAVLFLILCSLGARLFH